MDGLFQATAILRLLLDEDGYGFVVFKHAFEVDLDHILWFLAFSHSSGDEFQWSGLVETGRGRCVGSGRLGRPIGLTLHVKSVNGCFRNGHWGKAADFLERSLYVGPTFSSSL